MTSELTRPASWLDASGAAWQHVQRHSSLFRPRDTQHCPLLLFAECVIEVEGRRVSDGEIWKDSADNCVSCSCNVRPGGVSCPTQVGRSGLGHGAI